MTIEFRHRTHDEARAALRDFCDAAWGNRTRKDGTSITIFTIPKDEERDADCILYDVLRERDVLRETLKALVGQHFQEHDDRDCPDPLWAAAYRALHGAQIGKPTE